MRRFAFAALLGSSVMVAGASAQNSAPADTSHKTAAANEAASPKRRPMGTKATDALTENGPETPLSRSEAARGRQDDDQEAPESAPPAPKPAEPAAPSIPSQPMVQAVPPIPVGQPTADQIARIRVGASKKDMLSSLGNPATCLTIPDDGHLRESCQYFSKGSYTGTVQLDNGLVVKVEPNK